MIEYKTGWLSNQGTAYAELGWNGIEASTLVMSGPVPIGAAPDVKLDATEVIMLLRALANRIEEQASD